MCIKKNYISMISRAQSVQVVCKGVCKLKFCLSSIQLGHEWSRSLVYHIAKEVSVTVMVPCLLRRWCVNCYMFF